MFIVAGEASNANQKNNSGHIGRTDSTSIKGVAGPTDK